MSVRPGGATLFISIGLTVLGFTGCSLVVDTSGLSGGASSTHPDGGGLSDANALGDATTSRDAATEDGAARALTLLAAGGNSTCARVRERLFCWGANEYGQLGDGTKLERGAPVPVNGLPAGAVSAIGVGERHACAVVAGDVFCWGDGGQGTLGDGNRSSSNTPVKVVGLPAGQATTACGGTGFSCAVASGSAYCWGVNNRGQVGGEVGDVAATPVKVAFAASDANRPGAIAEVSCGQDHACARSTAGDIWCWGHNDNGTLGATALAVGASVYKGTKVDALPGPAQHLAFAGWHACVTVDGAAWCWGTGDSGELGNGGGATSVQPVPVTGLGSGVTALATGGGADDGDATCAIRAGAVSCWGHGQRGRLGDSGGASRKTPFALPTLTANVTAIAVGYLHACVVLGDDDIRCWGAGDSGQLGDDGGVDRAMPVSVKLPGQ